VSDFYSETKTKARKVHKCYWCGKEIKKDEQYFRVSGVFHGDFSFRKECLECNDLVKDYCYKYPNDAQDYGIDHETIREFRKESEGENVT
jgi:hypothetical protein